MRLLKKKKIPLTEIFGDDFVDIHSHILPGIDDGAKNMEDSLRLISTMRSYGIKNFITTPHVLGDFYPNSTSTILSKLEELKTALRENGMTDINISASAEYMLDEQFFKQLKNKDILPLKGNYILVEMSYFNAPINLYDMLFDIQLKGYIPILAHPERYNFFHDDFRQYYKLKKNGCLFQLNILSLTSHYGMNVKNTSNTLLKLGMYDFIGTDTHHSNHLKLMLSIGTEKKKRLIKKLIEKNTLFLN